MITEVADKSVKNAREKYVPTFKKKSTSLNVPELDESFCLHLKSHKNSTASKLNIVPDEKMAPVSIQAFDLGKPLLFLQREMKSI